MKKINNSNFITVNSIELHEVFDNKGNRINGVKGIQHYKDGIIVFTENSMYSNCPEIHKIFKKFDK